MVVAQVEPALFTRDWLYVYGVIFTFSALFLVTSLFWEWTKHLFYWHVSGESGFSCGKTHKSKLLQGPDLLTRNPCLYNKFMEFSHSNLLSLGCGETAKWL